MLESCINSGINYIDTAEAYSDGLMETVLGSSLKRVNIKREDLVISTKFYWKGFDVGKNPKDQNKVGLSNKHI